MADPLLVSCPANQWKKVATNVTSGFVHKIREAPQEYLQTYRISGGAAPITKLEGIRMFSGVDVVTEAISASVGIDVYVYALTTAGLVRVDV